MSQENARLILEDGTVFEGVNFGASNSTAGEVVFSTGMMGYPESLTDPSYTGQILILTYPLVGNYGVPDRKFWESNQICVSGLIVCSYNDTPSHFQSTQTLAQWFKDEKVPLLEIKDTRFLTQKIRDKGMMLGKIVCKKNINFYNPDNENLVSKVSPIKTKIHSPKVNSRRRVLLIDCGAKRNIQNALLERNVSVIQIPWDASIQELPPFDGVVISNGPGNPKLVKETIQLVQQLLKVGKPILGVCLGHQLLALAAGGDTNKLRYGHRSQNQPCLMTGSRRCFITTQNHGFAVSKIPSGFKPWFTNANDNTNEGIIHSKLPFMSVQFHPEATPGPADTEWVFDEFIARL